MLNLYPYQKDAARTLAISLGRYGSALDASDTGVGKTYRRPGGDVVALQDVDLRIDDGDCVAVTGPSGSGKSTLLSILGCLDRPTSGKLFIEGQETGLLDDTELTHLRGHNIGLYFSTIT